MTFRFESQPFSGYAQDGSGIGHLINRFSSGGDRTPGELINDHAYGIMLIDSLSPQGTKIYSNGSTTGTAGSSIPGPSLDAPSLHNGALNALNKKIQGHEFNLGVFASEIPKAVDMIKYQSQRLYGSYKYARKGQFIKAARVLSGNRKSSHEGKIASNFLEWTYGILPLMRDIYEATKFIDKHVNPIKRSIDFRVGIKVDTVRKDLYYATWDVKDCKSQYQLIAKSVETQPMYVELGLTDPYTVVWNLLPYSFVLDWLLPIGPWLEAMNVERHLKFKHMVTSNFVKNSWSSPNVAAILAVYGVTYVGVGSTAYKYITGDRKVVADATGLSRIPSFNPLSFAVNTQHTVNGLALIANRTSR